MAHVFYDMDGDEHELYDEIDVEELIEVTTGRVIGYRASNSFGYYKISKETYEAIMKIRKRL